MTKLALTVGWSMSERASTELVVYAVNLTVGRRQPKVRGSQYTSLRLEPSAS